MGQTHSLERAVVALQATVEKGGQLLRLFNESEWPVAMNAIFENIAATQQKHVDGPRPSIITDYVNITTLLSQFEWPEEEIGNEERDSRIQQLRGVVGNVRMDVDRIIQLCSDIGAPSGSVDEVLPVGSTLLPKGEHGNLLRAIEKRLTRVEVALLQDVQLERNLATSPSENQLVDYFIRSVRTDISLVRASLRTGPNLDLGIMERASISMIDVTGRMIATVGSRFSQASERLKKAVVTMREPVRRFAKGVHTFIKYVLYVNTPSSSSDDHQQDEREPEPAGPRAGEILKAARENRDLSLEDVARHSRVGIRFLQALENEDFSAFSAEHYIVGFGKSYAKTVGEPADAIAGMLKRDLRQVGFKPSRLKDVWFSKNPGDPH